MILIADSGSTKTKWSLVNEQPFKVETNVTGGINPFYQSQEVIAALLKKEFPQPSEIPDQIFFYGAGCINNEKCQTVAEVLTRFFHCNAVIVESDLMAVAHALCLHEEGIACILGTGSNSCYYNGNEVVHHVSPLGYILGDEGSGAVIGKKFISDLLKNQLPEHITARFYKHYSCSPHQIMEDVYKKPFPNRYLARYTYFIHENLAEPSLKKIVRESFDEFFSRNIRQYPEAINLPIHFTGSIAYHFCDILKESAVDMGYRTGLITESPTERLIKYYVP
jgi:glucosamine kinase